MLNVKMSERHFHARGVRCLSMALRIVSSFRMQAVRASFFALPAAREPLVEGPNQRVVSCAARAAM